MKMFIALGLITTLAAPAAAQTTTSTTTSSTTSTTTTAAAAADIVGTWDATFTAQQGPIPGQLVFKKEGAKIVGTVASQVVNGPAEVEVNGKNVTVRFNITRDQGPIAIQLDGTVDGDTIKGSIGAGGQAAGTWVATKSKESKESASSTASATSSSSDSSSTSSTSSLTGTWNVTIELPNMTANPSMVLKQDGEKITGEYVSAQYGKFPMTGTLKGTDVVMSFQMNVEGNSLTVTYSGKVENDGTMKGSVTYGDMMSGTFSAALKK